MITTQQIDFEPIINLQARDLLSKILEKQPEKRPSLEEMSMHPWVTNNGWEPLDLSEA
jgi:[calcium/calmodulin-dependent protein kinase] kinase